MQHLIFPVFMRYSLLICCKEPLFGQFPFCVLKKGPENFDMKKMENQVASAPNTENSTLKGPQPLGAPEQDTSPSAAPKTGKIKKMLGAPKVMAVRQSAWLNLLFAVLIPAITMLTLEWIARGTLGPHNKDYGFFDALQAHTMSFFMAYLLLFFIYLFVVNLFGNHLPPVLLVGLLGNIPATVTYFKLTMRGEPFLPWDVFQVGDLLGVSEEIKLSVQSSMVVTLLLFILLAFLGFFVRLPCKNNGKIHWPFRLVLGGASAAGVLILMLGIFLSPAGTAAIDVKEDMWMQDRYYRTNGVITGFLTNLQLLNIDEPADYSEATVQAIADETMVNAAEEKPLFATSPAAMGQATDARPDIIFVMAESFWDVTSLPGIEYDRDLLPNLTALSRQGGRGMAYTPSFGGGTCDVEFEALTGFSVENLPAGSKPYQQYVTKELFSLPNLLKERGYETLAIHGYGRRFWNRDQAYPRLGIDTFIAQDDFEDPLLRRGFISDEAMVDRIIEEHTARASEENPVFIHAITMQNHTTYSRDRYPADELVRVTNSPASLPDATIGQLEDCATGIYEMDAALGKLTDYLRTTSRPTILVFWGDHLNPMDDGYALFEKTGFIENGDTASPALHQTPLLIWSNQSQNAVDLGIVATYDISPVMMDLYGLEKPIFFEFLSQQMEILRVRTRGVTVNPNGSYSEELTEAQAQSVWEHAVLQYDMMFGQDYMAQIQSAASGVAHAGENTG